MEPAPGHLPHGLVLGPALDDHAIHGADPTAAVGPPQAGDQHGPAAAVRGEAQELHEPLVRRPQRIDRHADHLDGFWNAAIVQHPLQADGGADAQVLQVLPAGRAGVPRAVQAPVHAVEIAHAGHPDRLGPLHRSRGASEQGYQRQEHPQEHRATHKVTGLPGGRGGKPRPPRAFYPPPPCGGR